MRDYDLIETVDPDIFGNLMSSLWPLAGRFSFTVQEDLGISEDLQIFLKLLSPFAVDVAEVRSWPGTQLHSEQTAQLHRFDCLPGAFQILQAEPPILSNWLQPARPEDLALYRQDGSVLLQSVSHENFVRVSLSESEHLNLSAEIASALEESSF